MKKKLIPFIIAVVLIIAVTAIGFGAKVIEKFTYSKEEADLNEYFQISDATDVAIRLQNDLSEGKGKLIDNVYYLPFSFITENLNDRFYYNSSEGLLLYTTPTDIIRNEIGSTDYYVSDTVNSETYPISFLDGDKLYVAVDYVKKYTNFGWDAYNNPNHAQVTTSYDTVSVADIKKDTQVRYQGGVKSNILEQLNEGDTVTVLEEMENWTKVKTADSFIGYVENKRLENAREETPQPVNEVETPVYTNISKDYKINMAFHQVLNETANTYLGDMISSTSGINTIAPTWFTFSDDEGNVTNLASHDYVKQAHDNGMEVWAVLDNVNQPVDTNAILSKTSNREKTINTLMTTAIEYDIDGINVDIEQLSEETGDDFIEFIRELSIPCRANGIVLSVDNYVPKEYSSHYDRKEQGIVADYVVIMGYDEHYASSEEAGSVASIDYVDDGIAKTLEEVPAAKVINAVPFYTRVWSTSSGTVSSEAVGMETAQNFLTKNGLTAVWDETTCQNYAEFTDDTGTFYQVWMEDTKSLQVRLNVMENYKIAGIAEWKLGFETSDVWDTINTYINQ